MLEAYLKEYLKALGSKTLYLDAYSGSFPAITEIIPSGEDLT